jgi:hypothetical protein
MVYLRVFILLFLLFILDANKLYEWGTLKERGYDNVVAFAALIP